MIIKAYDYDQRGAKSEGTWKLEARTLKTRNLKCANLNGIKVVRHPSVHHVIDPHQFVLFPWLSLSCIFTVKFLAYKNVNHKPFADRLTNSTLTDCTFGVVQSFKMCLSYSIWLWSSFRIIEVSSCRLKARCVFQSFKSDDYFNRTAEQP